MAATDLEERTNTTEETKEHLQSPEPDAYRMTSFGGHQYSGADKLHHLIITIKSADISHYPKRSKWSTLDPYVKVLFDNTEESDPNKRVQTRKIYRCNTSPTWLYTKRTSFKDMAKLPKQLTFMVMDYNEDPTPDTEIGEYVFDIEKEQFLSEQENRFQSTCNLVGADGQPIACTLCVGIFYRHCSISQLTQEMHLSRQRCKHAVTDKMQSAFDWIDDNRALFKKLKTNEAYNIQITHEDFSDMSFPPFELIKDEYANFLYAYCGLQQFYMPSSTYSVNASSWKRRHHHGHHQQHAEKQRMKTEAEQVVNYQIYYDADCDVLYYAHMDGFNFGGENITAQVQIMFRYIFLKDILLHGQDAEFNIYRSYYLEPRRDKVALALLAMATQSVLTVAISIDVFVNDWGSLMGQQNWFIVACSVLVFCFLSYSTNSTAKLFVQFYKHIALAYDIPWFLLFCDFFSNVLIAMYICLISLFFLVQSPTFTELVLNSFALSYLIEIDDMINIFDSDEEVVITADLREFVKSNCVNPRQIHYRASSLLQVFISPLKIFSTIWIFFEQFYSLFIRRRHKMFKPKIE